MSKEDEDRLDNEGGPVSSSREKPQKCDNGDGNPAKHYTQGGAVDQWLCDECAPPWYKDSE